MIAGRLDQALDSREVQQPVLHVEEEPIEARATQQLGDLGRRKRDERAKERLAVPESLAESSVRGSVHGGTSRSGPAY
jgi:hypothetical protein